MKEMLFVEWTAADWVEADALVAASERLVGRTALVHGTKAALVHAWRRDSEAALARVHEIAADPLLAGLPVVQTMLEMEQVRLAQRPSRAPHALVTPHMPRNAACTTCVVRAYCLPHCMLARRQ